MGDEQAMIGIVVGLVAEARIARRLGCMVEAGGGTAAGAQAASARLIAQGATSLISLGLAGGLDPALAPGTLVIPARIVSESGAYQTDEALSHRLGATARGTLLGAHAVIGSVADKRAAHAQTGALAVDLESAVVAEAACRHGIPFAALRAICDPAGMDLPPAALLALDAGGAITIWPILRSIAGHPAQIGAMLRLAAAAAQARRALLGRVRRIAPAAWARPL